VDEVTVLLVRHGQSTWNADGRWQGQADPPLSTLGVQQAVEAAAHVLRLGPVDAVWASDLERARHTAATIAEHAGVELTVDARFRERHAGPWQGLRRDEIDAQWPDHLSTGRRPDGYEPDAEVVARALAALDDLAVVHPGQHVVVVTHGGVIRQLEVHFGDRERGLIPNLSGRRLRRRGASWTLGEAVLLLGEDTITVPGQL
jgi:broad specificity phosphatase PhoE